MKRFFLFFLLFLTVHLARAQQVGVNTDSPQGVFHVDPMGNTSGTTNISDDMIVTGDGNIGLGTASPAAKLHPVKNGAEQLLRIVDGTQGAGKILRSDANGNASWVDKPPASDGQIYHLTGTSVTSYANGTYTLLRSVPVTVSGNFLVTIRWWGVSQAVNTNNMTGAEFYVVQSSNAANNWSADQANVKDRADYYVTTSANARYCFSTSLFANIQAGTNLKVYIRVVLGGPWQIGTASTTSSTWNPSIVVYRI